MANNQLTFNLGIKTDVDLSGLNELKRTLKDLGSVDVEFMQNFSAEKVNKVTSAVRVLDNALDAAFDINLNGINFNTFQKSIEKSGMSLSQIQSNLSALGPEGTAAFAKVTSQVYQMNSAVQYTNKFTQKLFDSFKNTVMYTGFNAILNTATKTVSQAMGYIKDLDRSLNNIRIVTQKSAEDMKEFAVQANNAAQALGTTTTDYTDASLIYYQQGLNDEEVAERTNVTIKMANALGASADEVSEYMTAIWNNFDDGTKSLESFGDTITALGAATASSSEEIAQGLEKFAAVADTVGLSYEYATTALATVVSETRQSADIVGTAFKTLFARIQDLELGDTLDDGTTLGKYSQALEAVGINIKDANGNLKDMDIILDEMGSKWQSLSADTQVALAQTVAGTRQYTQLVALMSNWDKFQTNLKTASTAEGTLTKQNEIYMDSMQAHLNKLKAASEDLYSSLFNDKDIKNFYDMITNLIKTLDHFVESFGGLSGIIPAVLSLGGGAMTGQISTLFSQADMNKAAQAQAKLDEQAKIDSLQSGLDTTLLANTESETSQQLGKQLEFIKQIYDYSSLLTEEERKRANELMNSGAELVKNMSYVEEFKDNLTGFQVKLDVEDFEDLEEVQKKNIEGANELQKFYSILNRELEKAKGNAVSFEKFYDEIIPTLKEEFNSDSELLKSDFLNNIDKRAFGTEDGNIDFSKTLDYIEQQLNKTEELRTALSSVVGVQENLNKAQQTYAEAMSNRAATKYWLDVGAGIGKVASGVAGITKIGQIWSNKDLSLGQKMTQTLTNMVFYFPIISSGWKKIASAAEEAAKKQLKALEDSNALEEAKKKAQDEMRESLREQIEEEEKARALEQECLEENQAELDKLTEKYNELEQAKIAAWTAAQESGGDLSEIKRIEKEQKKVDKDKTKFQNAVDKNKGNIASHDETLEGYNNQINNATNDEIKELEKTLSILRDPKRMGMKGLQILAKDGIGGLQKAISDKTSGLLALVKNVWSGLGALGPIALGVTAAFVAGKVAIAAYNNHLEKNALAAEESAKKSAELAQKKKEEYENLKNLKEAYNELKDSEDIKSTADLRNETYKLCLQYGEEELAVKALSASYEELNDIMDETIQKSGDEYKASAERAQGLAENSVKSKIYAAAGGFWGGVYDSADKSLMLKGSLGENADESNLLDSLRELGSNYGIEDLISTKGAGVEYIGLDQFVDLLSKDSTAVKEILEASTSDMAAQLLEYMDAAGDSLDSLNEISQEVVNATRENISNTLTANDVTAKNFLATRNDIYNQLIASGAYADTEEGQEKAWQEVNKILSQYSGEALKNVQAYSLTEILGKDFDELSKYNTSELAFFAKLQNYIKSTDADLDEFLNTYKDIYKLAADAEWATSLPVVLTTANENGKFEQEDIDALFPDDRPSVELEAGLVITKTDFEKADFASQTAMATQMLVNDLASSGNASTVYQDKVNEIQQDINDINLQEYLDKVQNYISEVDATKEEVIDLFGAYTADGISFTIENLQDITSEQAEAINALAEGTWESTAEYLELLKQAGIEVSEVFTDSDWLDPEDSTNELANAIKSYATLMNKVSGASKEYQENQEAVLELTKLQEDLTDGTRNAAEANELVEKQYDNLNNEIDRLQSQYSSLQSVVEDFNDNGKLSIDSVQKLITLDNAYVASLEFVNGQLMINNESYESLMDAQIALMKVQVMNDLITDLHAIKEGTYADQTMQTAETNLQFTGTIQEVTNALVEGSEAFDVYARKMAGLNGYNFGTDNKYAEEAIKAAENKLKLIDSINYYEDTGSGGSDKTSKKDTKDYDDEYDRYWDINNAIEKVTHALEQLDKAQEKLSRNELISSLREENKLLEIQAQKYQDLAAEQNKEAAELREQLQGYGIIFDNEGQIQNYLAQTKTALDQYNSVVADYNAGNISDESFEAYEKDYNTFKEVLDKYDELFYDKMVDTQDKLDDITRQIKENNLTGWETELTLKLDTHQADRDWNDFIGKIEDNFKSRWTDFGTQFRTAVFDANSLGGEGGTIDDELKAAKEVMAEIDKMEAGGDSSMFESISQAQDKLKELQDQLVDDAGALFDLYQNGWDNYNSAIDEVIDKFGEVQNSIEAINADLNHQSKIIELLYGQQAYDFLDSLYNAQSKNYLTQLASLRDQNAFYQSQYEKAAAEYGADSDAAQKFKTAWDNAIKDLHAAEEAYLENLAKSYANTVAKAFSDAEKKLMKGSSYNFVSEQWNLAKEAADGVYDDQEKIYQLEKLSLKYQEAIDKASTTKSQQKLQDLYESQVKSLEDRTTLTEYDITLAEKRLAVAQAEADLEDARNNKNALKVTRDTAGNWSYQYVADEGDLDDKQQALLDAQYEAYEYVKQNVSDLKEEMIKLAEDWSTTIADLEAKMIGATEEEKAQYQMMIDWYNDYYATQMNTKADELKAHEVNLAEETNALLATEYMVNTDNYNLMIDSQKRAIDEMAKFAIESATDVYNSAGEAYDAIVEHGDEAMRETIDYFATAASDITDIWSNNPDSVKNAMLEAMTVCTQAQLDYGEAVREGCIAAGEDYADVEAQIYEDVEATEELQDATSDLVATATSELAEYESYLSFLEDAWYRVKDSVYENGIEMDNYIKKLGAAKEAAISFVSVLNEAIQKEYEFQRAAAGGTGSGSSSSSYDSSSNIRDWKIESQFGGNYGIWDTKQNNWVHIAGTSSDGYNGLLDYLADHGYISDENLEKKRQTMSDDEILKWMMTLPVLNTTTASHFASGGYTGDWGNDDGKFAVLHQKELVLNADDTSNMLEAVSIIRQLSGINSSIQSAIAESIAAALGRISGVSGTGNITNNSSSNNVYNINAEFPAANDVNDIREALLSLPNLAAQRTGLQTI